MNATAGNYAGVPSPYGRACTTCVRAKAKCVISTASGTKCERCTRLNKDCQAPSSARKRRPPSRTPLFESARLEKKLDGLYSLLTANSQATNGMRQSELLSESAESGSQSQLSNRISDVLSNAKATNGDTTHLADSPYSQAQGPTPATSNGYESVQAPSAKNLIACTNEPSPWKAEELLKFFRADMLKYMPFMIIPSSQSAFELRRESPFLWLCIMAITSKSSSQQTALSRAIRSNLGRLMLVDGERSLDLLYGTITCIAWGQYYLYNKPILSNLVQLAIALLAELGLNKAVSRDMPHLLLEYAAQGCPEKYCQSHERTMSDRRVAVGCFIVTSVVSTYFSKVDSLPWTPYLDECLGILGRNDEVPGDLLLVQLARLQLIDNQVAQIPGIGKACEAVTTAKAPWAFYLRTMQAELGRLREAVPSILQEDRLLNLHLHSTEAKIHEIAFSSSVSPDKNIEFLWIESLHSALHATKKWFDLYFTFTPSYYVRFSLGISTQIAQSLVILYRLSILDHPCWDRGLVRQTCDLTDVLNTFVERLTQVKSAAQLDYDDDLSHMKLFEVNLRKLTSIKAWWQAKEASQVPSSPAAPPNDTARGISVDPWGDAWLNDMLMMDGFQFEPIRNLA